MNRILQADLILTLTAYEALCLLRAEGLQEDIPAELWALLVEQCAKQGVEL